MIRATIFISSLIAIVFCGVFATHFANTTGNFNNPYTLLFFGCGIALFAFLMSLGNDEYEYFSGCCNDKYRIKIVEKKGYVTEYYPLKRIWNTNLWVHMSYDWGYGDQTLQYVRTEAEAQKIIDDDINQPVVTNKCACI